MELPPLTVRAELALRYARLLGTRGQALAERPLVLPNAEFFPDVFRADAPSLERLLDRMLVHTGLSDLPLRAELVGAAPHAPAPRASGDGCGDGGCGGGGCGDGGCGGGCGDGGCGGGCGDGGKRRQRAAESASCSSGGGCSSGGCADGAVNATSGAVQLARDGVEWVAAVPQGLLSHPVALTANLARLVGHAFALETRPASEPIEPEELGVTAELAATALGLGALVLQGSYIYAKSCGGPRIERVTELSCPELAVASALFIARGNHRPRAALALLEPTPRSALRDALAWVDSNPDLVLRLQRDPETLASLPSALSSLSETRPWLARVFARRPTPSATRATPGDA